MIFVAADRCSVILLKKDATCVKLNKKNFPNKKS